MCLGADPPGASSVGTGGEQILRRVPTAVLGDRLDLPTPCVGMESSPKAAQHPQTVTMESATFQCEKRLGCGMRSVGCGEPNQGHR